jgi:cytochrome c-type biogenesis protein
VEDFLISAFNDAPYIISIFAGVLTFFSPCILPLIPAYLSFISGISVKELNNEANRFKILKASLVFISGFTTVFILLGAPIANAIGEVLRYKWLNYVAGGIIIIFALHILRLIEIKFLNFEARADFGKFGKSVSGFAPFLLGASFALGWSPCIGPILGSILMMGAQEEVKSLTLMLSYSFGLAIPFIISALITQRALKFFNSVKRQFRVVEIVSGTLLLLIGIAIATDSLSKISGYFIGD